MGDCKTETALRKQRKALGSEIDALLARIVEATNPMVISAYEKKIGDLGRERLLIDENLQKMAKPQHTFEHLIELSLRFLASPWKLWDSGQYTLRKTVLRLAFSDRISYDRKTGLGTPKTTLPFKVLQDLSTGKCKMVQMRGII